MNVYDNLAKPQIIFETTSEYNDLIQVVDINETRKLYVNDTIQSVNATSPSAHSLVWGRLIDILKEQTPELSSILVLGLGGGTSQHLIAANFANVHIVSVEIDPVMIEIAKRFFNVGDIPNHQIIEADACRVIIEPQKFNLTFDSFEAVYVDIFVGDVFPDLGESGNFLAHIKKMVAPTGLVVFNRHYRDKHQEDVDNFADDVEVHFSDVETIVVPGKTNSENILIYGRA